MSDIVTQCLSATGATPAQAERAALAIREPDAIEILVRHQEAALVRHGAPMDKARAEAEEIVSVVLEDLGRLGLRDVYLCVALRRARVYRLRCQGHPFGVICQRLGVSRVQADKDYRAELARRRVG